MSDNELDNLFKEAAEGFKAPNDPSAWKDMSKKLDQAAVGTSTFWNWKTISLSTVTGVTSLALVWYLSTGDKKELLSTAAPSGNITNVIPKNNQPINTEGSSIPQVEAQDKTSNNAVNPITKNIQTQESDKNPKRVVSAQSGEKQERASQPSNLTNNVSGNKEEKIASSITVTSIAESSNKIKNAEIKNSEDLSSENKNLNQSATVAAVQGSQKASTVVQTDSLAKVEEDQKEINPKKVASKELEEKSEEALKSGSPFAIKLTVAPDYAAVKSSTPEKLGVNYGALFEYRFSDRWSIATGGIWTKKIYTVYDVEYNGRNADVVNGDCRMWDIPINVYYNFLPAKRLSFYGSLGLSSYIMNEENYVYIVKGTYGTYDYAQQIKGENNEWFKILNVSAGIQWKVSTYFSFQFEPTLKAPLAGVGEGEVSLVSLGAFLNVRYEIPFKKSASNDKIK